MELNLIDENIKLIEKFFTRVISEGDELNSRKSFLKSIKVNSGLRAWDILVWGEKNFLDIENSLEEQLLSLGEDIFYRSLLMGALGVILSSLYGCNDINFLKSVYHLPLVVDSLYLNNSKYRDDHSRRPTLDQEQQKDFSRLKSLVRGVNHESIFFYAEQLATKKMGSDDEDYLFKVSSVSLIFQKLEKRIPLKIRFFDHSQWDFFKNNLFNGIFFVLKNKKFFKEVG